MRLWRKPLDQAQKAVAPGRVSINRERCKGCGYCVAYCPRDVLRTGSELSSKGYQLVEVADETKCVGCGFCSAICPEFAIEVSTDNTDNK